MKTTKILTLTLTNGTHATFFLNNTQNLVVLNGSKTQCTLIDGLHNNGGWPIGESASSLIKKIKDLMVD
jgi:hypothetical protein